MKVGFSLVGQILPTESTSKDMKRIVTYLQRITGKEITLVSEPCLEASTNILAPWPQVIELLNLAVDSLLEIGPELTHANNRLQHISTCIQAKKR